MKLAPHGPSEIRVLSSLLNVIEDFDPDILFLMETDQTWIDAVQPAHARYSTLLREPRPDH